jgi:hypothetical protein
MLRLDGMSVIHSKTAIQFCQQEITLHFLKGYHFPAL